MSSLDCPHELVPAVAVGVAVNHIVNVSGPSTLISVSTVLLYPTVVNCGPLSTSALAVGGLTVSAPNTVYNSVAVYICAQVGFDLIGQAQRICTAGGTWSGTEPFCQSNFCISITPCLLLLAVFVLCLQLLTVDHLVST